MLEFYERIIQKVLAKRKIVFSGIKASIEKLNDLENLHKENIF
jgi:hypothetical protein